MGLINNKYVAKFINGGSPPATYKEQARNLPPPEYNPNANPQLLRNDRLEKTQIHLNLPTQREREQLEREEKARREREGGKGDGVVRRVQRRFEHVTDFGGRAGGFGGVSTG